MWKRPFSGSDLADLDAGSAGDLTAFVGASTGLLSDDDVALAAGQIEPGTSALLIVYENRWAGAFVAAVRRNGGELIAFERIHTSDLVAALDAAVLPGARAASCAGRGASASAAGSRPHHPAQAAGRAEGAGSAHRRGVRLGEGPDPRPVARGHRADRHTAFTFTWVNRPAREHRPRLAKDDLTMDGGVAICEVSRFDGGCVAPRCLVRSSVREWDGGDDG